jgi:hypothetical protein
LYNDLPTTTFCIMNLHNMEQLSLDERSRRQQPNK